uniref:Uncharacterized protein n=1 Tax=Panagrolaimus sp. JU765 TaxID=591449 RepID=A0AC34QA39_9BILA
MTHIYFQVQNVNNDTSFLKKNVEQLEKKIESFSLTKSPKQLENDGRLIALIGGNGVKADDSAHLKHIHKVFNRLGYKTILNVDNFLTSENKHFDVLWNHEYTFFNTKLKTLTDNPKKGQKINHIPGSGFYTSKVQLATANLTIGVPLAFALPKQKELFLDYAKENPNVRWVQKSNAHRNIKVLPTDQIDLDKSE